jgi:FemAB-related protein (PEP-CTERM system-associated)
MSISVELLDLRDSRSADRFVMTHPDGTPFHETRWLQLVRSQFGFETQTLIARRGADIVGVLPLAMVTAPITGRRLVSVPYGVYGGILAVEDDALVALDEAVQTHAANTGARYVEMRYVGQAPTQHQSLDLYETYRCELPSSPEDVLGTIPRKARAEVRRARNRYQAVLVQGAHIFDDFYDLYVANKQRLGSPLFPARYFRCLLDLYGPRATLHGVAVHGRLVCAVLSMLDAKTAYPYYSGAVTDADRLGANNALYAFIMEDFVRRGCDRFDFGRSRRDSGPAAFKRHMGFTATPLDYQFYFPRGGHPPSITPSNPKTAVPRRILAGLPVWAARLVGPMIMRHVP